MIPVLAEVGRNIKNAADRSLTVRLVRITLGATLSFASVLHPSAQILRYRL